MDDATIIDWRPIATFPKGTKWAQAFQVLCCHDTQRWIRFGRHYGELDRTIATAKMDRAMTVTADLQVKTKAKRDQEKQEILDQAKAEIKKEESKEPSK